MECTRRLETVSLWFFSLEHFPWSLTPRVRLPTALSAVGKRISTMHEPINRVVITFSLALSLYSLLPLPLSCTRLHIALYFIFSCSKQRKWCKPIRSNLYKRDWSEMARLEKRTHVPQKQKNFRLKSSLFLAIAIRLNTKTKLFLIHFKLFEFPRNGKHLLPPKVWSEKIIHV